MARELKFRAWDGTQMVYQTNALSDIQRFFRVIREDAIVMQFTGLLDKNSKEIYEGDIIEMQHPYKKRKYRGEVKYDKYCFMCKNFYMSHLDNPSDIFSEGTGYIEVIGSVHQNPELLKC
jgi:uncharacterized phage protein (TIGR01671 family)